MDFYSLKEGIDVEFKKAEKGFPKSFYETYSAFANTCGGHIYLGIEEKDGKVISIPGLSLDNAKEYVKIMFNSLNNKEKVSENIITDGDIKEWKLENGNYVLDVYVKEQDRGKKPIYLDKQITKAYKRNGENDYLITSEELVSFMNDRYNTTKDSEVNDRGYTFDDIEQSTLTAFRNVFNSQNKGNIFESYDDVKFCKELGFIAKDKNGNELLTNAAVLFFTKAIKIQTIYPNYFLDYQEKMSGETRWDYRLCSIDYNWTGNLFDYFLTVFERVVKNIPNKYEKEGVSDVSGLSLQDAIKEMIVNAMSNADFISGGNVRIIKTPAKITCINSGNSLIGIDLMKQGGVTNPRNKEIIRFFRLLRYSERSGYGVKNILTIFDKYKLASPNIEENNNPQEVEVDMLFTQGYFEELSSKITSQDIIGFIAQHKDGVSQEELMNRFDVSAPTIVKYINLLITMGVVKTNGKKTKGKKYLINETY
ncbi:MAG: HTH domain-containing protein [Clostridiales bacterium]|nr:HTH domain-containing protein [Clostridiales bacterium]